jgi:hypothetical protein
MNVYELIKELEKIPNKQQRVFIRGSNMMLIPVEAVCTLDDNCVGLLGDLFNSELGMQT